MTVGLRFAAGALRPDVRFEWLRDGSRGWYVLPPRTDSCVQAAYATCLQVPIGEVPDLHLDERVERGEDPAEIDRAARRVMSEWFVSRGLRLVVHRPVDLSLERWIGVVELPGVHQSHCLIFARDRLLFDPTLDWYRRQERLLSPLAAFGDAVVDVLDRPRVRAWGLSDATFGLSFETR